MKKMMLGLSLCVAFGANAQKRLDLNVKIPGLPNGDTVWLWGPLTNTVDTAVVKNGTIHFDKDMTAGGSTYIMQVGKDGKEEHGTFFYLEAGKMNVTGKGPYFQNAVMTGSPFVADWVDISKNVLVADTLSAQKDALTNKINAANQIGDADAANEATNALKLLNKSQLDACLNWVNSHPNSGASSFLINAYLSNMIEKTELVALINKLGPDVQNTFTIKKMLTGLTGGNFGKLLNNPAPAVSAPDANGNTISLADLKGKYVLLDFWASWCKPCRDLTPALAATYEKYKNKGFTILSVSLDDNKAKWLQAIAEDKMVWPQVCDLKGAASPVAVAYGVQAIPASMLIDPDGKIIVVGIAGEILDTKLATLLK